MEFQQLFADQFKAVAEKRYGPATTRSSKLLEPIHSKIAELVEKEGFSTRSLSNSEYEFIGSYGSKKVDIAIFNGDKFVGAINFKGIRSEYNKNANNYYENMKGESDLFINAGIPIMQIIFIPIKIHHKKSNGEVVFETPTQKSKDNYKNFLAYKSAYWDLLTFIPYYLEVNYDNFTAQYCENNISPCLTDAIMQFIGGLKENV